MRVEDLNWRFVLRILIGGLGWVRYLSSIEESECEWLLSLKVIDLVLDIQTTCTPTAQVSIYPNRPC